MNAPRHSALNYGNHVSNESKLVQNLPKSSALQLLELNDLDVYIFGSCSPYFMRFGMVRHCYNQYYRTREITSCNNPPVMYKLFYSTSDVASDQPVMYKSFSNFSL